MAKKKFTGIRREIFRGKYYIIARENGKAVSRRRWSSKPIKDKRGEYKTINKDTGFRLFKQNRSFSSRVKRTKLINVSETVDYRKGARTPSAVKWQYVVSAKVKTKTGVVTINARSMRHDPGYSKRDARREALTSFYERLAESQGLAYDEDEGKSISKNVIVGEIREGVVYYS